MRRTISFTTTGTGPAAFTSGFVLDDAPRSAPRRRRPPRGRSPSPPASSARSRVEEAGTPGWVRTALTCVGVPTTYDGGKATFTIGPGDAVTCGYENKKNATITITKDAEPAAARTSPSPSAGWATSRSTMTRDRRCEHEDVRDPRARVRDQDDH